MHVNHAAFATSTVLAAATAASAIAAAATASTVALVAYAILAVGLGGVALASVTAWFDPNSTDVEKYFGNMKHHAGIAVAGFFQFFAQTLVQALIQGIAGGVGKAIERKIAGPDITFSRA